MITEKDLYCVGMWPGKARFPGKDYAIKAVDLMHKAHDKYLKMYKNNNFEIIFSNGEDLVLKILDKNVGHLLGVDNKNLARDVMKSTVSNVLGLKSIENNDSYSYMCLTRILERAEDVIKNDANHYAYKILNYYRIMIKCSVFLNMPTFKEFNYGCINSKEGYLNSNTYEVCSATKFLFANSDEQLAPYFLYGIRYDREENFWVPVTALFPLSLEPYLRKQELILPIKSVIDMGYCEIPFEATSKDKLKLLHLYKDILEGYDTRTSIDFSYDYENMLKEKAKTLSLK